MNSLFRHWMNEKKNSNWLLFPWCNAFRLTRFSKGRGEHKKKILLNRFNRQTKFGLLFELILPLAAIFFFSLFLYFLCLFWSIVRPISTAVTVSLEMHVNPNWKSLFGHTKRNRSIFKSLRLTIERIQKGIHIGYNGPRDNHLNCYSKLDGLAIVPYFLCVLGGG